MTDKGEGWSLRHVLAPERRQGTLGLAERNARLALRHGLRDVAALADAVLGPKRERLVIFDCVAEADQPRLVGVTLAGGSARIRLQPAAVDTWEDVTELYGDLAAAMRRFLCLPVPAGLAVAVDELCVVGYGPTGSGGAGGLTVEAAPNRYPDERPDEQLVSPAELVAALADRFALPLPLPAQIAHSGAGRIADAKDPVSARGRAEVAAAGVFADLAGVQDGLRRELEFLPEVLGLAGDPSGAGDVLGPARVRLAGSRVSRNVDCGAGWARLVAETVRRLAELDPGFTLVQVKEKFGALRVYADLSESLVSRQTPDVSSVLPAEAFRAVIAEAEAVSRWLCEVCGRADASLRGDWPSRRRTLCARHRDWR